MRRFGVRLTDTEWVKCDLEQFNKELNYLKDVNYFLNSCKTFENAINLSSQNKSILKWNVDNNASESISRSINSMYQEYNEAVAMENRCRQYAKQIDDINVPITKLETEKRDKSNAIAAQRSRVEGQAKSLSYKPHNTYSHRSNEELRLDIEKQTLEIMESNIDEINSALSQAYRKRVELIESMTTSHEKANSKFVLACCDIPEREYKRILYSLGMLKCKFFAAKREEIRKSIEESFFASVNKRRTYLSSQRQAMIKLKEKVKQRYGVTVEDQSLKGVQDRGKVNVRLY